MHLAEKFEKFLESVNLNAYREKYRPIKLVEIDLPKEIQAISLLYETYWDKKKFLDFEPRISLNKFWVLDEFIV